MDKKERIRDHGIGPLALLFVLNAVDEFDRSILAVALDAIREDFGVSDTVAGLLPLAFVFVAGVLALPAGNWSDRWIRKYILSGGAVVWATAGFAAALSPTFTALFASRILLGAGQGTIGPTHLSLLSDYYPVSVRGRALSYHRSANPFGQILGAGVGAVIVTAVGWRFGFVAAAVPGLILGLVALRMREPRRGESDVKAAADDNLIAAFMREPENALGFRDALVIIWRTRTLRYLIYANAAIGFSLIGVVFWLPTLFERRFGFSTGEAAAVFGGLAFAAFIGSLRGAPVADKMLPRGFDYMSKYGALTIGTVAIAWPLAFLFPIAPLTILLLVSSSLIASIGVAPVLAVVAAVASPRIRSQAFAAFGLALSVCGAAIAPVLVGIGSDVLQRTGMNSGDALRLSMFACTLGVMAFGTWQIWRCGKTSTEDANRTIAEFLASFQQQPATPAEAPSPSDEAVAPDPSPSD